MKDDICCLAALKFGREDKLKEYEGSLKEVEGQTDDLRCYEPTQVFF